MPLRYKLDLTQLVSQTKGMSGRDIKEKVLKASLHNAIANDEEIITSKNIDSVLKSMHNKTSDNTGMFN